MAELVSAAQLAELLAVSYGTVKVLAAQQRWFAGELPMPVEGSSPRRWRIEEVDRWLMELERSQRS